MPTAADPRWHSVLTHDPRADGAFVYAVTSTRIYCHPICPSRRPPRLPPARYLPRPPHRRRQPRPRGRPQPPSSSARLPPLRRPLSQRLRPRLPPLPVQGERAQRRLRHGGALLRGLWLPEPPVRIRRRPPRHEFPRVYADGGRGIEVRYASGPSPAGTLLLAASERGICALSLGDDEAALVAELRREFPTAVLREEPDALRPWVQLAAQHVAGATPWLEIPLDIRASAFQRRVWEVLRRIPPGETISYGALAQAIGVPKAARAVGRACATNPVSLAVPCHRAVGSEGAPRGYRWGVTASVPSSASNGRTAPTEPPMPDAAHHAAASVAVSSSCPPPRTPRRQVRRGGL